MRDEERRGCRREFPLPAAIHRIDVGTRRGHANGTMVMRRAFPQHHGSRLFLVVAGCCICLINIDDVGYVHNEVPLGMGNSRLNRTAEQYTEN